MLQLPDTCTIEQFICDICSTKHNYPDEIANKIKERDPRWTNNINSFPANDPIWDIYNEEVSKKQILCLTFSYDDNTTAICFEHLKEIIHDTDTR